MCPAHERVALCPAFDKIQASPSYFAFFEDRNLEVFFLFHRLLWPHHMILGRKFPKYCLKIVYSQLKLPVSSH